MTLTIEPPKPGGAFTPPITESLRGGVDIVTPMLRPPAPVQRQPGDVWFDFEDETPPPEDFEPYLDKKGDPAPVIYWEPFEPGLELQPYPRIGGIASTFDGRWVCRNKAEEEIVRERLARLGGGNADQFRLTDEDKRALLNPQQVTACGTCKFTTTSTTMWNYHRTKWQHQ